MLLLNTGEPRLKRLALQVSEEHPGCGILQIVIQNQLSVQLIWGHGWRNVVTTVSSFFIRQRARLKCRIKTHNCSNMCSQDVNLSRSQWSLPHPGSVLIAALSRLRGRFSSWWVRADSWWQTLWEQLWAPIVYGLFFLCRFSCFCWLDCCDVLGHELKAQSETWDFSQVFRSVKLDPAVQVIAIMQQS